VYVATNLILAAGNTLWRAETRILKDGGFLKYV
jgi:hypothetical protein